MAEAKYLDVAESAKLLRKKLAAAFPGAKFSVKSKRYAGGSSISVHWTDGPSTKRVEAIADIFAGKTFDGMIDLASYLPEIEIDGVLYHRGCSYVFCSRDISDAEAKVAAADARLRERCRIDVDGRNPAWDRFGNSYVSDLARNVVWGAEEGETLDHAIERIVFHYSEEDWARDAAPPPSPKPAPADVAPY